MQVAELVAGGRTDAKAEALVSVSAETHGWAAAARTVCRPAGLRRTEPRPFVEQSPGSERCVPWGRTWGGTALREVPSGGACSSGRSLCHGPVRAPGGGVPAAGPAGGLGLRQESPPRACCLRPPTPPGLRSAVGHGGRESGSGGAPVPRACTQQLRA